MVYKIFQIFVVVHR